MTVSLGDSLRRPSSQTFIPIFIALLSGGVVIQLSISGRHSFAGGENGYAVSGGGEREAKGCVDAKLANMPVVWSGW